MKKFYFLLFLGMFLTNTTFSQMSFNGNSLKKSAFDLTAKKANFIDNSSTDKKIVITDEDNDMLKKRRKKRGGHRGGGGDFSNSIKVNPLNMIFGRFGLQYERKIADNMSLGLTLGFYSQSTGVVGLEYKYSGFSINPEFRYYFADAIEGWYASPYIIFTSITQKYTYDSVDITTGDPISVTDEATISQYGGGIVAGHQWIWGGFTLDLYAGIGYTGMSISGNTGTGGLSFSGILPTFGTAIGYSF